MEQRISRRALLRALGTKLRDIYTEDQVGPMSEGFAHLLARLNDSDERAPPPAESSPV